MENLYTSNKTAEILCVSEMTLRKWRWEGKGPKFVKIGRKVAYREEDIKAYISSMVRSSTSDNGEGNTCSM
jgi:predicted site-specific integrase-resolvase